MGKIIAVSNNKGGSGKTTLVSNIGYALAQRNKKVLLIDSDMQMNLTRSYDIGQDNEKNLYNALSKEENLRDYIKSTKYENIDIIISDYMLSAIDMQLVDKNFKETLVKRLLEDVVENNIYDFIIIDTCPFLGLLNYNILVASDYVMIPVELSAFGVEGLEPLSNFIQEVKIYNKSLEILGIIETKVDNRESTTLETRELLRELFADKILKTSIPVDINIKKSQFQGVPVCDFDKNSRASVAYNELSQEIIEKIKEE